VDVLRFDFADVLRLRPKEEAKALIEELTDAMHVKEI
jgi:hypothetical protein